MIDSDITVTPSLALYRTFAEESQAQVAVVSMFGTDWLLCQNFGMNRIWGSVYSSCFNGYWKLKRSGRTKGFDALSADNWPSEI